MTKETATEPRTIGRVECAKMIRTRLKTLFPGVKFSVTSSSYSGGGSIDISWTDGPALREVEAITDSYQSSRFDSSIDYGYSVSNFWLMPDGSVRVASCEGSACTGGYSEAQFNLPPDPNAELVNIYSGFVFCRREYSAPFLERIAHVFARENRLEVPPLIRGNYSVYLDNSKLDYYEDCALQKLKSETDARIKPVYRYNHAAGKLEPVIHDVQNDDLASFTVNF